MNSTGRKMRARAQKTGILKIRLTLPYQFNALQ
jgi:hypothetical protein